ncbi:hypothetical protein [Aneurinibacillus migulanus]|uniref:Uncharacterized protein n=1 Tax=Aneurinibacillus migulanus TaxID=47500 RepID=A0A1G8KRY8_ANEMI|nr:hypothetical protein [Aneurinibacillus migulanus]KIV52381.1 hypothetical protein TS65_23475 [Aneurinibacillus migulanus]MED0892591.1 hypothetical protein [Aneurinibacillus migulanus]MED1614995.1 hypothetical protein [Aneurinibacillus migulanus]SDI46198.1 hypothetical protein SAMN04487909_10499 [Aneurinibacillus migulanus]
MHASACSLVFFSQGRDTAALWRQGRTGKTSGPLGAGDSCRSISSVAPHAPHRKTKGTHAVRVILFYPSMDTKGVDCSERKRLPQRDTNKAFRLPFRAVAPARRKRTATVSLFVSTQMFCSPAWLGQKAALYASVRETNRRPFGARCGGIHSGWYWIINTLGFTYDIDIIKRSREEGNYS